MAPSNSSGALYQNVTTTGSRSANGFNGALNNRANPISARGGGEEGEREEEGEERGRGRRRERRGGEMGRSSGEERGKDRGEVEIESRRERGGRERREE